MCMPTSWLSGQDPGANDTLRSISADAGIVHQLAVTLPSRASFLQTDFIDLCTWNMLAP